MKSPLSATLAGLLLASCVQQAPKPLPAVPAPPAAAPPVQAPPSADWRNWPVTGGNWRYSTNIATFSGTGGVTLRIWCDRATRQVSLGVPGPASSPDGTAMMTVRTDAGTLQWPARTLRSDPPAVAATRAANDPGLDQIAYARGRFAVELPGTAPIVAPNWAELSRVIEDCRG